MPINHRHKHRTKFLSQEFAFIGPYWLKNDWQPSVISGSHWVWRGLGGNGGWAELEVIPICHNQQHPHSVWYPCYLIPCWRVLHPHFPDKCKIRSISCTFPLSLTNGVAETLGVQQAWSFGKGCSYEGWEPQLLFWDLTSFIAGFLRGNLSLHFSLSSPTLPPSALSRISLREPNSPWTC